MKSVPHKRAAFTLVEMLVTIALIGLLASVVTAVVIYARRLAVQVECKAHLAEIGKTLNSLAMNSGGEYPQYRADDGTPWWAAVYSQWDSADPFRVGALPETMQVFHCKAAAPLESAETVFQGTATQFDLDGGSGLFYLEDAGESWTSGDHVGRCLRLTGGNEAGARRWIVHNDADKLYFTRAFASSAGAGDGYEIVDVGALNDSISYGINFDVMDSEEKLYSDASSADPYSNRFPGSLTGPDREADAYYYTKVATPGRFILASEANVDDVDVDGDGATDRTGARISMAAVSRNAGDHPPYDAPIVGRHDGKANVLFADLHVEAIEIEDADINDETALWTLPDD